MQADDSHHRTSVRYEPNDKPPKLLTFGLALQFTILCIAGVVLY